MDDVELGRLVERHQQHQQTTGNEKHQQVIIARNTNQTHYILSQHNFTYPTPESPFPTPSPSPSIILTSPAPPPNIKSPSLYSVKSPVVKSPSHSKSPAPGCNARSPGPGGGGCNPQSPAQAPSPFYVSSPSNSTRSPASLPPTVSPAHRPPTPQPTLTQYSTAIPNTNIVQILHQPQQQTGQLVARAQLLTSQKVKQPPQILPKPLSNAASSPNQKSALPRLNTSTMTQQPPLVINQQTQSPTLLLNQVLTPNGPLLLQQGHSGTVQLILRPPTPTLQSGPGPPQNKMIFATTNAAQAQPQAVLIQNRQQQVMRIMTTQGPMQLQQIQTPTGPQLIAIPHNQALSFPTSSLLVQNPTTSTLQLQQNTIRIQQNPIQITSQAAIQNQLTAANGIVVRQKQEENYVQEDQDSKTNKLKMRKRSVSSNESPPPVSMTTPNPTTISTNNKIQNKCDGNTVPVSKSLTSSLRQIRPGAFANRAKNNNNKPNLQLDKQQLDNLTATINSVAENIKSTASAQNDMMGNDLFLEQNKNLSLNKRPNLTIVQKLNKNSNQLCAADVEANVTLNKLGVNKSDGVIGVFNVDYTECAVQSDNAVLTNNFMSSGVQTGYEPANDNEEDGVKKGKKKNGGAASSGGVGAGGGGGRRKGKKEENKLDLWDLMKSAGIGDDEFDVQTDIDGAGAFTSDFTAAPAGAIVPDSVEISAESELLAQLANSSQAIQLPGGLRLALGEDGRPIIIDSNNILLQDSVTESMNQGTSTAVVGTSGATTATAAFVEETPQQQQQGHISAAEIQNLLLNQDNLQGMTQQAITTAQAQLSQLLQDHNTVTPSDQQLLSQLFGGSINGITSTVPLASVGTSTQSVQPATITATTATASTTTEQPTDNSMEQFSKQVDSRPSYLSDLPPLGHDSLVITNNNGVPTLVASPALMQYLQTHQGIIQFQHDPVTKTIQPSLIIPHQPSESFKQQQQQLQQQQQQQQGRSSVDLVSQDKITNVSKQVGVGKSLVVCENKPTNIVEVKSIQQQQNKMMTKFIQDNPTLLQIAKETNNLITIRDTAKNLTDKDVIELDRKIQQNRMVLDQCYLMETSKQAGAGQQTTIYQQTEQQQGDKMKNTAETQTLQDLQDLDTTLIKGFQGPPSQNSPTPNSDFQNKYLESIGIVTKAAIAQKASVGRITSTSFTPVTPGKRTRKKKGEKVQQSTQVQTDLKEVQLSLTIPQLTHEQNIKLNLALQQRGVTSQQIATVETNEVVKQIVQEEIIKITCGNIHGTSIKFVNSNAYTDQEQREPNPIVLNNPSLNQLLDQPQLDGQAPQLISNNFVSNNQILTISGNQNQLVSLGNPINSSNQIVTLGNSTPPNGSVIVGANGNVVAVVHQTTTGSSGQQSIVQRVQTIQLTPAKQQQLKNIQAQIQSMNSKANRTHNDQTVLQRLMLEQQKIISTGKIVQTQPQQQQQASLQLVPQQTTQQPVRVYQQQQQPPQQSINTTTTTTTTVKSSQQLVSCGTNTSDINPSSGRVIIPTSQHNIPKLSVPPTVMISDNNNTANGNYGPLYVSPNSSGKHVTKCEKGTSPIQVQMGTQTVSSIEGYRVGKMSTGTMTSPNTGKPQAVVAPAIVIQQVEQPQQTVWQMKPSRNQIQQQMQPTSPSRVLSRTALIEQQMKTDQSGATMPDTHTQFTSKSDAVKRLIRYHCMEEKSLSSVDLATADDIFDATAQHLLDKFRVMKEKYKYLLLLESMREVSTAERIMVDRNFIIEERLELEDLRESERRLQEELNNPSIRIEQQHVLSQDEVKAIKCVPEPREEYTVQQQQAAPVTSQVQKPDCVIVDTSDRTNNNVNQLKSRIRKHNRQLERCSEEFSSGEGDINAQVQSAIDSILNLQKVEEDEEEDDDDEEGEEEEEEDEELMEDDEDYEEEEDEKRPTTTRTYNVRYNNATERGIDKLTNKKLIIKLDKKFRKDKKRKHKRGGNDVGKKQRRNDSSDDCFNDDDDDDGDEADPVLNEAIRSILTS